MNDLPVNPPVGSPPGGRPSMQPDDVHRPRDIRHDAGTVSGRPDSEPIGLGSAIGFFLALMLLFIMAAAVAQFAVRGDSSVGQAPGAPPVAQDQTPAQPSPPADGNPAGATSPDAVTP